MKLQALKQAAAISIACRVGEPHVLGGDHQQAPCDEERVLARLQHARDPVDGCLRVAAPLRETKRPLPR